MSCFDESALDTHSEGGALMDSSSNKSSSHQATSNSSDSVSQAGLDETTASGQGPEHRHTAEVGNLVELLSATVKVRPTHPALMSPNQVGGVDTWTYERLWREIEITAAHLSRAGICSGDMVGLLAESRSWWPICDFAIMSLGACTVPIYPSLPSGQIAHIMRDSGMKGLILQDTKQLQKLLAVERSGIPELEFVVTLDVEESDAQFQVMQEASAVFTVYSFHAWLHDGIKSRDILGDSWWRGVDVAALATIVYTSGTTGLPKGVMLTHANLLANVAGILRQFPMQTEDTLLSYLPLSHIFERTVGQMVTLSAGGTIFYSRGIASIMADFLLMPPTLMTTVPRLLEKVYESTYAALRAGPRWRQHLFEWALELAIRARVKHEPVSAMTLAVADRFILSKVRKKLGGRLRAVISGGAPLPRYIAEFVTALGIPVMEGYGMTETSPVVCFNPLEAIRFGTAGKVLDNVQVRIAEDGEILVKGPSMASGYFRNPEATRELYTDDGWLRTGDIGALTADNYLSITDRKKSLIVLSTGKKVTPTPIEEKILRNRYIDQAVLLGQARKFIAVVVVPNADEVRAWYEREGMTALPVEEWPADRALNGFLLAQVQRETADCAEFEQPKKILVTVQPFTIENGLLTPTLKVKAHAVQVAYAEPIQLLYAPAPMSAGNAFGG